MKHAAVIPVLLPLILAAGCSPGPRYTRPPAEAPVAWKSQPPWREAAPKDSLAKGAWWEVFADPELSRYERQLLAANPSLAAARDRLDQARSIARIATSGMFPQLSADPSTQRERLSGNRETNGPSAPLSPYTQSVYNIPFTLSYEADLFGRVRRNVEAANASLEATAADLQNAQLVLTAELAADYFTLREVDAELEVVRESVSYQRKGLELVSNRHNGGIASGLEVAQQSALLDSTLTQLSLLDQSRAQYEHAVAVLVGQPASSFAVPTRPLRATPPAIPLGVPSQVLERRPDIAGSERLVAYQNAQVGIARSAFYPHITLGASGGLQSRTFGNLFTVPSLMWAVGADALEPIFQGGRNRATLEAARSGYDQAVANYRQAVLNAFQQVEDGISSLNALSRAANTQAAAVEDAHRELEIANNRYAGGITSYLDVITAQSTLLSSKRLAAQLLGEQMVTSVYLVKALGGDWNAKALDQEQVHPEARQAVQP